ncbi:MAG: pectate lyase [Verrucomicrobiota bacterium]
MIARAIAAVGLATLVSSCATLRLGKETHPPVPPFPSPSGEEKTVRQTIIVRDTYDGNNRLHIPRGLGDGSQKENQRPLFRLVSSGAVIKNVHFKGADGIHVEASDCQIINCVAHDVGEDAITIEKPGTLIKDSWFRNAADKVIQINGGSARVDNCTADNFGCFVRLNGEANRTLRVALVDSQLWNGDTGVRADGPKSEIKASRNRFYDVSHPFELKNKASLQESDNLVIP